MNSQALKKLLTFLLICQITKCFEEYKKPIIDSFDILPLELHFEMYHTMFNKQYLLNSEEAVRRKAIFSENYKKIKEHNSLNNLYTLDLTEFADLSEEEFEKLYLIKSDFKSNTVRELQNYNMLQELEDENTTYINFLSKSNTFDPINHKNLLQKPRNQKTCGSCWTFSVTAAVEAALAKKSGVLQNYLSNQQLIDCDKSNHGCNGGDFEPALKYVKENGLTLNSNYPYINKKQTCQTDLIKDPIKIKGFKYCSDDLKKDCTEEFVYKLLLEGPLMIGIDAKNLQHYHKGLFDSPCKSSNHMVVLVGFGTTNDGQDYWLVRNSWGSSFGEQGHVRVLRNKDNKNSCFVTSDAFLPIV
jgi:C1A family cysteine protease